MLKCVTSSNGCDDIMRNCLPRLEPNSAASTSTVWEVRSPPFSPISTGSTRRKPKRPAAGMDASPPGRTIPQAMVVPRSISADCPVKRACSRNCGRCSTGGSLMFAVTAIFFDAAQNARVVRAAEHYYRLMYRSAKESWNLARHMFDSLVRLLAARGGDAKAIVWAHNSHVGNAAATAMGWQGEFNIGSRAARPLESQQC